jgi:hypothetical protein
MGSATRAPRGTCAARAASSARTAGMGSAARRPVHSAEVRARETRRRVRTVAWTRTTCATRARTTSRAARATARASCAPTAGRASTISARTAHATGRTAPAAATRSVCATPASTSSTVPPRFTALSLSYVSLAPQARCATPPPTRVARRPAPAVRPTAPDAVTRPACALRGTRTTNAARTARPVWLVPPPRNASSTAANSCPPPISTNEPPASPSRSPASASDHMARAGRTRACEKVDEAAERPGPRVVHPGFTEKSRQVLDLPGP